VFSFILLLLRSQNFRVDTLLYYVVVIIEHNNLYYVDVPIIFYNPIIKFYNIVLRTIIFKPHIWGAELDVQSQ
jgi:hypothetical protein